MMKKAGGIIMNELLQWIENQGVAIAMLAYMIWKDNTTMKKFTESLTTLTTTLNEFMNTTTLIANLKREENEKV